MENDLYCKIYLKLNIDLDGAKNFISEILDAGFKGRSIRYDNLQIDLFQNKDEPLASDVTDRAVFWKYYLEIEPVDAAYVPLDQFIGAIAKLLVSFKIKGVQAIASCDFEDQLTAMI